TFVTIPSSAAKAEITIGFVATAVTTEPLPGLVMTILGGVLLAGTRVTPWHQAGPPTRAPFGEAATLLLAELPLPSSRLQRPSKPLALLIAVYMLLLICS